MDKKITTRPFSELKAEVQQEWTPETWAVYEAAGKYFSAEFPTDEDKESSVVR